MSKLTLSDELAAKFTAGLLTIVRTDGKINATEGHAVQQVVGELIETAVDCADAMLEPVTPASLAAAIRATGADAAAIAEAFVRAASRVAASDGELTSHEANTINRYAAALGVGAIVPE